MIEQITSLVDDFAMRLQNPVSDHLYKVDSVNLIIGDNGTGKTKAIKGIISELAEQSRLEQYSIEGDAKELGIVYYTAAPFHKKLASVHNKQVTIIDASPPRTFVNGVATAAREYQKVADSLNIPNPLQSTKTYSFRELAFRCVRRIGSSYKDTNSSKVAALYEDYQALSRQTIRFSQERKRIEERQHALLAEAAGGRELSSDVIFGNIALELDDLSQASESHASRMAALRECIIDQFLLEVGPNNKKWATTWMVACLFCESAPSNITTIAKFLSGRNEEQAPKSQRWEHLLVQSTRFIKALETSKAGTFEWSKDQAKISVDVMRLLESKAGEQIFEAAHRVGLLSFGFDSVSSGEAAVLNQLTSITNAIHEIKRSGKNKVLIFIDEGDILLHLSWQRRYLNLLDERLGFLKESQKLKSLQIVVATHSPLLASDVLRASVTRMGKTGELPAFGAPIQAIINRSFDTPSIGEIAEREILRLQAADRYSSTDLALIEQIDDDFVRQYLKKPK
jgi:predicted ATPase